MANKEEEMEVDESEVMAIQQREYYDHDTAIPDQDQVLNKAGKFVFQTGLEADLIHFLRFGQRGNLYTAKYHKINLQDAECVTELIKKGSGMQAVAIIRQFSDRNLAYKQEYPIYALAICCRSSDLNTKRAAYDSLSSVCRIPSHLFSFIKNCQEISKQTSKDHTSGWGRAHRQAINDWYIRHGADEHTLRRLASHLTKYGKRSGWTHRSVLRRAHVKVNKNYPQLNVKKDDPALKYLIMLATKGKKFADGNAFTIAEQKKEDYGSSALAKVKSFIDHVEEARTSENAEQVRQLILRHKLTREHISNRFLGDKEVWKALIRHMPLTAVIRNLGKMSKLGCFEEQDSFEENLVLGKLKNTELISKANVHPITFLIARNQYKTGQSRERTVSKNRKGRAALSWTVSQRVIEALWQGFIIACRRYTSTNKNILLSVEVGKSLEDKLPIYVRGMESLQTLDVAMTMIKVMKQIEPSCEVIVFTKSGVALPVDSSQCHDDIYRMIQESPVSDGSLSFKYALQNQKYNYDAFIILTDSEWSSSENVHPSDAFKTYCDAVEAIRETKPKLVVCNMVPSKVTIGDPKDRSTLTINGFDLHVPRIINDFIAADE
ncbi:RNA-binding protein RO60-like [Saccostrea echinata]|uniref:RNA-binding protein RO60-like n=1 Tax=Saccostrea echinata TaxID=191078 RepID=UPI002A821DC8|nr:RNA-binding protein RO60-like [Saccostrea echinata]